MVSSFNPFLLDIIPTLRIICLFLSASTAQKNVEFAQVTVEHIDRGFRPQVKRDQQMAKKELDAEDNAYKSTTENVNSVTEILLKDLSEVDERVIIEDGIQRLQELLRRINNKTRTTENTSVSTQNITFENTTACSVFTKATTVTTTSTAVVKVTTTCNINKKATNITTKVATTTIKATTITTKTMTTKATSPIVEYFCNSTPVPERPRCRGDTIYELTEFGADVGPGLSDLINMYLYVTNDMMCLTVQ